MKTLGQRKGSRFAQQQFGTLTRYVRGRKEKNPMAAMLGPELNTLYIEYGRVADQDYFLAWHQIIFQSDIGIWVQGALAT